MSFQLNDWYTARFHGARRLGQPGRAPRGDSVHAWAALNHIFRITQPYVDVVRPSGATGLVDTAIFDLVAFNQPWGRWGVGISGTLPTGPDGLTAEKWTAGPALGFVDSSAKHVQLGPVRADASSRSPATTARPTCGLLNLQPILSYQLGEGRSISLGNSALVYDSDKSRWSSLMTRHQLRPGARRSGATSGARMSRSATTSTTTVGNQQWVVRAGLTSVVAQ